MFKESQMGAFEYKYDLIQLAKVLASDVAVKTLKSRSSWLDFTGKVEGQILAELYELRRGLSLDVTVGELSFVMRRVGGDRFSTVINLEETAIGGYFAKGV